MLSGSKAAAVASLALMAGVCTLACCLVRPATAGINLSWNDCGAFGTNVTPLTCTSNVGELVMIVSATPPAPLSTAAAHVAVLDLQTTGATLSPWWDMRGDTGCRRVALSASYVFTFFSFVNCVDAWDSQAIGGFAYDDPLSPGFAMGANRARLRVVCARSGSSSFAAGTEYYLSRIVISKAKTVGLGSCSGCTDDATILLNQVEIDSRPDTIYPTILTSPDNGVCIR